MRLGRRVGRSVSPCFCLLARAKPQPANSGETLAAISARAVISHWWVMPRTSRCSPHCDGSPLAAVMRTLCKTSQAAGKCRSHLSLRAMRVGFCRRRHQLGQPEGLYLWALQKSQRRSYGVLQTSAGHLDINVKRIQPL